MCLFFLCNRRLPRSTLFPYTTLFRSGLGRMGGSMARNLAGAGFPVHVFDVDAGAAALAVAPARSEEHTSELQSLRHLVCRLLLEKKKEQHITNPTRISQVTRR